MINYNELGPNKCLNEIVVAGSHDAGITSGKDNVQTQGLNIFLQASVGVRFFDLRIAAAAAGGAPGEKRVELKAFHADGMVKKDEVKIRQVGGIGPMPVVRTKLRAGAFGIGLEKMLEEAKDFVQSPGGNTEFLILKFDKCQNWMLIAEACTYVLHDVLYKAGGNLNTTKLRDLQRKVVVLFSPKGVKEVAGLFGPQDGILGFKNLNDKDGAATYEDNFQGLQYFGKGGTSVFKPFKKLSQNVSKQGKVLQEAKASAILQSPHLMAMMYWTTTGMFESIKSRNKKMWDPPNVEKMKKLWARGLSDIIEYRNPLTLPSGSPLVGPHCKRFMPNIVMIDFADQQRCQTIRDLNNLSPHDLAMLGAEV
ncbi:MAG: hypothetical protein WCA20_32200 [Candidatus Sulfotelmatobacter sp.]